MMPPKPGAVRWQHNVTGTINAQGTATVSFPGPPIGFTLAILGGTITSTGASTPKAAVYKNTATDTNRLANTQSGSSNQLTGDGQTLLYPGEFPIIVFTGGSAGGTVQCSLSGILEGF